MKWIWLIQMKLINLLLTFPNNMESGDSTLQDSVVGGDLHIGDVNQQTTNIDRSTNIDFSNLDQVGEKVANAANVVGKSGKEAMTGFGNFLKGIINRFLLFATVTVLVLGFLIYNGNIDVNELIRDMYWTVPESGN